jgi:hypothetical protein
MPRRREKNENILHASSRFGAFALRSSFQIKKAPELKALRPVKKTWQLPTLPYSCVEYHRRRGA